MKIGKRVFLMVLSLWCMVFFGIGCSPKTEKDLFYECQKKLNNLESYRCEVEIVVQGNKSPQTYRMKQWFEKPNKYRLEIIEPEELKGKITVSDGNKAGIIHKNIGQVWTFENFQGSQEQSMFLGYFIKNYLDAENVKVSKQEVENIQYLVIDTEIPGKHPYFTKEKLWIQVDGWKPARLQVFDIKEQVKIDVKYKQFEYNPKLGEELFNIQN